MKSTLSIIVAIAENRAIGKDNQLLWHIPEDLKYFKRVTSGNTVIMGRKTWESLGRPLPNRVNVVVSRTLFKAREEGAELLPAGVGLYNSLEEAIEGAKKREGEELFIIGGGEIYRQALPLCNKLYLTIVNQTIEDADTHFPEIDFTQWEVESEEQLHYGVRLEMIRK